MIKLKKRIVIACAVTCGLMMSQHTYVKAIEIKSDTNAASVSSDFRLHDDFYDWVNSGWLKSAKIEDGHIANSSADEIIKKVNGQKKQIIQDLLANEKNYDSNSNEKKIINLYNNYLDMDARNKLGIEPVKKILEDIKNIKDIDDVTNLSKDSQASNTLINFKCAVDSKDSTKHALYIDPSILVLGDADAYENPNENSQRLRNLEETYYKKILTLVGYTEEEADVKIDNSFKLQAMIARSMIGRNEASKMPNLQEKLYNIYTIKQLDRLAPNLDIKTIMKNYEIDDAKTIILQQPKWLEGLSKIYTNDNLQLIKDYLEINNLDAASGFLSEDFEKAQTEFLNAYTGAKGELSREDKAISFVDGFLGMPLGEIYVEKFSSKKVKNDVTQITNEFIDKYKDRLEKLDWISDETKSRAIEKLDNISLRIGYPDNWGDYSDLDIKSAKNGGSLWQNIINISEFIAKNTFSRVNEPVDKSVWVCTPQTVNAFYSPTQNSITVPAGILQGEFYNDKNKEAMIGSIGAIIGHEISHAFDNNGAKYDSNGNLENWWTEEDYKKFEEKTKKVRDYYSLLKTDRGNKVNGNLTLSENIADIGGMACALDLLDDMDNPNYRDFFESNARVWRQVTTEEAEKNALQSDPHSPSKIRVNVVLPQFEEFYKTYGIGENDKMYIKPSDRLKIW